MNYEKLLIDANLLDIQVKELDLKTADGLCYGNRIAINKNLKTDREKYCVLAEELGHYHKTVGNILDITKINNAKQENIARRWAYNELIQISSIVDAYKHGLRNIYEIADFLNVTEEFLKEALENYAYQYGLYYIYENYIIKFNPLEIIENYN